jgi:tripartite-type tricarboxylate transporter receptor subunit TctC
MTSSGHSCRRGLPKSPFTSAAALKARLVGLGLQPMSLTSAEFGKFIADQTDKWAKVIKSAGIKPE